MDIILESKINIRNFFLDLLIMTKYNEEKISKTRSKQLTFQSIENNQTYDF